MRRIALAVMAITTLTIAALGADIQSASAANYNWTGFYIGANLGGGWASQNQTTDTNGSQWGGGFPGFISSAASPSLNSSGFTGGVQAGWNSQNLNTVWGIEGDIRWMSLKSSKDSGILSFGGVTPQQFIQSAETTWVATLRGRLGWAANNWLLYGTGGAAFGNVKSSFTYNYDGLGLLNDGSISKTKIGWTAGGGVEWAFAAHWTVKFEYLHIDLGTVSYTTTDRSGNPTFFENISTKTQIDLATVGLNYKF